MATAVVGYGPYNTVTLLAAAMAAGSDTQVSIAAVMTPKGETVFYGVGYNA